VLRNGDNWEEVLVDGKLKMSDYERELEERVEQLEKLLEQSEKNGKKLFRLEFHDSLYNPENEKEFCSWLDEIGFKWSVESRGKYPDDDKYYAGEEYVWIRLGPAIEKELTLQEVCDLVVEHGATLQEFNGQMEIEFG
jgi:hypothetical protein